MPIGRSKRIILMPFELIHVFRPGGGNRCDYSRIRITISTPTTAISTIIIIIIIVIIIISIIIIINIIISITIITITGSPIELGTRSFKILIFIKMPPLIFKILAVEGLSQTLDLKMNSVDCLTFSKF